MIMQRYRLLILSLFVLLIGCSTPSTLVELKNTTTTPSKFFEGEANNKQDSLQWDVILNDPILKALIDTAIQNNKELQLAYQKIELARNQCQLTKGNLLPQLSVATSGAVRKFGLYTMDGAGNIATEMTPGKMVPIDLPDMYVGLQSTWEVDIRGRLKNLDKAALSKFFASQEGYKFVVSSLAADVALSYYELLALDNELIVTRENAKKENEVLAFVKAQKEVGKVNELAVQQFTAQYYNLSILEKEILQNIRKEENRLNFLLGRYPTAIERNRSSLYAQNQLLSKGIPSSVLENRPDIKAASLQITASKFDLNAAKAAFYPSFTLNLGYGLQAFNANYFFRSPESIAYNTIGSLVAPLVNRAAIKSQFNTAKTNQIEAMLNYQQTILDAYVDVVNDFTEIDHLEEIKQLTSLKSSSFEKAVESSFELYKAARVPYYDVLLSQQNALQTNIELILLHKRSKHSLVRLFKNLGGRWQ
jgi:NodT family efflux transporter outer membrane factor (OMF) lipoprotein